MKHLRKAVALLFAILFMVFVAPRFLPTTSSLSSYGFYPPSNEQSAMDWASQPVQYVDTALCNTCHADKYQGWQTAAHKTVNCETCHGPAKAHLEQRAKPVVDSTREACGTCHAQTVGRRATFPQVDLANHNAQATCTTCHNPHETRSNRP